MITELARSLLRTRVGPRDWVTARPAPLGPLVAGFVLVAASDRAAIAVFAAFGLLLALLGTVSPSLRAAPSFDKITRAPGSETSTAQAPD
jgi:hypothetical protein